MNCFVHPGSNLVNMMVSKPRHWKSIPMSQASDNITIGTLHNITEHVDENEGMYNPGDTRRLDGFTSSMFQDKESRLALNKCIEDILVAKSKLVIDTLAALQVNPKPPVAP